MLIKKSDLIIPLFVVDGLHRRIAVPGFKGVFRYSIDRLCERARTLFASGIRCVLLFGVVDKKDERGSGAFEGVPLVARAVAALKSSLPKLEIMTDVCVCSYTSHGHCGILCSKKDPVRPDAVQTRKALARMALKHAQAGADWVAPSAMCPGQVKAIRQALDKEGYFQVRILAYSAKFASSFYGPFRQAARCSPQFGDRRGYQLPWDDANKALACISRDIDEGADMVMVKPALAYLDIIRQAKERFSIPLAAFNVSGEYAMTNAGIGDGIMMRDEILTAIRRAGADRVITYHVIEGRRTK